MKKHLNRLIAILFFVFLFNKSLFAQYIPGTSYFGVNSYIEYIAGDMPIIIVAPHAGLLTPAFLPDINTRGADNGTMELVRFFADSLHFKTGGCRPHIIINYLKPSKLNPVYASSDSLLAAGTNAITLQALNDFHNFIQIAHAKVTADWGKGHYFELHGNGTNEEWNMIGLGVSKTYLNLSDSVIMTRVNNSTIKNLCTVGGANFLEVLKGSTSLGGMLDSLGWKSTTSPHFPAPPDTVTFYYAGQNTWRYGSKNSGTIDATHLESFWEFMVLATNQSKYFNDLANSMLSFMNIHYGFSFNCQVLGSANLSDALQVNIYPNPSGDCLYLNMEMEDVNIEIYNYLNQIIISKHISGKQIDVGELPSGVYFLVFKRNNLKMERFQFIKN